MIRKILFTKHLSNDTLSHFFDLDNIDVCCLATLEIKLENLGSILRGIDYSTSNFIVTSQNSVKSIENSGFEGNFYVVGKKTSKLLQEQGRQVIAEFDCAKKLSTYLISTPFKKWNFLCGSTRREELIESLKKNGHTVNEVKTYHVKPIEYVLIENFDAYAFFSPLSFISFVKNNHIPLDSFIFSIGETTTQAIKKKYSNYNIITCKTPILDEMMKNIKSVAND